MPMKLGNITSISIHAPREGGDFDTALKAIQPWIFQSTPPARGATENPGEPLTLLKISIHAPREGGDVSGIKAMASAIKISIHAPREGGDVSVAACWTYTAAFQSTPPARGATVENGMLVVRYYKFQSTPPARGATRMSRIVRWAASQFQSTPPARGATHVAPVRVLYRQISIHAPREGGDAYRHCHQHHDLHFNPRPPRGGRRSARDV